MEIKTDTKSLNGIRGVGACIIAFIWHYQHFKPNTSPFYSILMPLYDHGDLMVEVFFMISGFCILLRYEDAICNDKISEKEYWARRVNKVFPVMILSTIVVAFLQYIHLRLVGQIFQYPTSFLT